jgi:phage gpG-like protein
MSSVLIQYHWAEPDPDEVAHRLITLANALEDFTQPMIIAGELTRADIQNHFDTQSDPSGRPWDAWADSYEPWALAHGSGQILNLTGALEGAATSPGAFIPTQHDLFIDTSSFPEYWAWNNFGAYDRATASTGVDEFGVIGGQANVLPERPFIGLSDAAKAKIDAVFFAWFEGEIALGISGTGKAFARYAKRGPGGRFVARDA